MRIFMIFELVIVFILLYLILNLLRYFFFPGAQGKWFGLSDKWLHDTRKAKKNGKEES